MTQSLRKDLAVSVTNKCNLACSHCLRGSSSNNDLSIGLLDQVLKDASKVGFSYAALTGGEIYLHAHLDKIVKVICDNNYKYNIISNGTYYKGYYESILGTKLHRGFNHLAFSLDGSNRKIHSYSRQMDTWDSVIAAIEFYRKEINNDISIHYLVSKVNMHDIPDAIRLAKNLGVSSFWVSGHLPAPPTFEYEHFTYREKQEIEYMAIKTGLREKIGVNFSSCFLDISERNICKNITSPQPYITATGELSFCCNLPGRGAVIGDLHETDFLTLWEELLNVANTMKEAREQYVADTNPDRLSMSNCDFCYETLKSMIKV